MIRRPSMRPGQEKASETLAKKKNRKPGMMAAHAYYPSYSRRQR